MTSEEKELQLKKIGQLEKIVMRLEWIIILMVILSGAIIFTIASVR